MTTSAEPHVVVEVLEDGGALAEDAVAGEDRSLLAQVEDAVVCGVARRVHRLKSGALHAKLVPVLHRGEGEGTADLWVGCVAPGVFV